MANPEITMQDVLRVIGELRDEAAITQCDAGYEIIVNRILNFTEANIYDFMECYEDEDA
jgi:hypothetical protein